MPSRILAHNVIYTLCLRARQPGKTTEILNARQSVAHAYIHTHTKKFTPVGDAYIHVPVSNKIGFREHVTEILNTRQRLRMDVVRTT